MVNESFTFDASYSNADQAYDNYAALHNVLFVNAAGNGTPPTSPGTSYDGISVAVIDGTSTHGPTSDGRSTPTYGSRWLHKLFDALCFRLGGGADAGRGPRRWRDGHDDGVPCR